MSCCSCTGWHSVAFRCTLALASLARPAWRVGTSHAAFELYTRCVSVWCACAIFNAQQWPLYENNMKVKKRNWVIKTFHMKVASRQHEGLLHLINSVTPFLPYCACVPALAYRSVHVCLCAYSFCAYVYVHVLKHKYQRGGAGHCQYSRCLPHRPGGPQQQLSLTHAQLKSYKSLWTWIPKIRFRHIWVFRRAMARITHVPWVYK